VLLVFPLIDGRGLGCPAWVFGVLAATVPVLAAFGWLYEFACESR